MLDRLSSPGVRRMHALVGQQAPVTRPSERAQPGLSGRRGSELPDLDVAEALRVVEKLRNGTKKLSGGWNSQLTHSTLWV